MLTIQQMLNLTYDIHVFVSLAICIPAHNFSWVRLSNDISMWFHSVLCIFSYNINFGLDIIGRKIMIDVKGDTVFTISVSVETSIRSSPVCAGALLDSIKLGFLVNSVEYN